MRLPNAPCSFKIKTEKVIENKLEIVGFLITSFFKKNNVMMNKNPKVPIL